MRKVVILLACIALLLTACGSEPEPTKTIGTDTNAITETEDSLLNVGEDVVDQEMTLDFSFGARTGSYTGHLNGNGLPDGEGSFECINSEGVTWKYTGTFVNGHMEGYGETDWDEGYREYGNYKNDVWIPSVGEMYDNVGAWDIFGSFALNRDLINYIDANSELFPKATKETIDGIQLQDFSSKQFNKTRKQEEFGLVKLQLTAYQVFEDDYRDGKLTSMLAVDKDDTFYSLYYLDTIEIYEGDTFTAYALPVATTSFENVSGGSTLVIVLLASYIE